MTPFLLRVLLAVCFTALVNLPAYLTAAATIRQPVDVKRQWSKQAMMYNQGRRSWDENTEILNDSQTAASQKMDGLLVPKTTDVSRKFFEDFLFFLDLKESGEWENVLRCRS
ncbi:uncharacterized protein [Branchiostoma lanceolatum]|uniref:uncharacterized protein n=1 Tax=Branchiostoma lanceolatum TaxID=7740 RepID=UPI00345668F1